MDVSRTTVRQARRYLQALTAVENLVSASGFTLNHVAIMYLLAECEPLSSSEIVHSLCLSPAMVTRCMDKLTALELVRMSLDETDLRKNIFRLQSRGRAILFELENGLGSKVNFEDGLRTHRILELISQRKKEDGLKMPEGITLQRWRVLLAAAEGSTTVGALALRANIAQPRASIAIQGLEQKCLMSQVSRDTPDARQHIYGLTPEGIALAKRIVKMIEKCDLTVL